MYELRLMLRDNLGNPTGRYKEYQTEDAGQLAAWFERNAWRKKYKRKKKKNAKSKSTVSDGQPQSGKLQRRHKKKNKEGDVPSESDS